MDADLIDHDSGVQPWIQVRDILTERIEAGLGGRLGGERQMAAQFGVSPASVRKALAALREAGLVETTRGYGSRILRPDERPER